MERLRTLALHPYFPYVYLFTVVFCVVALLALPANHPFIPVSILIGVTAFFLQRYRKHLLSKRG